MNRRDFIKSTAIGLGLITVPLLTVEPELEAGDGVPLFSTNHNLKRNRFAMPGDLTEAALEDLLVELGKYRNFAIKPNRLIVHPSWYS